MRTYFSDCKTVQEVKAEYRKLAMKFHPDRGGDEKIMTAINAAYKKALERVATDAQKENGYGTAEHLDDGYKYMYLTNTHWLVRFPRINDEWFSENTTNFIPVEQCEKMYATLVKTDDMRMVHLSLEPLKEHLRHNRKRIGNKYTISDENNIAVNAWYLRYMFDVVNSTYITCFYNTNKLMPLYLTDGKEFDIMLCPYYI